MTEDIRAFSSKVVDLQSIPKESASRIASLLQARRARVVSEAAAAGSQDQVITSMGLDEMEAEERAGRDGILKQEQKGFDWARRQLQDALQGSEASFSEYQKLTKWEHARDKKVRELEQQILRESFWNFQRKVGIADHSARRAPGERAPAAATIDDATVVLGSLFEHSMVPFATDVEECWRRGITQHPSQQTPATVGSPDRRRTSTIQPYYEFAEQLRNEYRRKPQDEWWRTSNLNSAQRPTTTQYRSTPMATFAHNYPYHVPPQ
jgi:hypothetical protein